MTGIKGNNEFCFLRQSHNNVIFLIVSLNKAFVFVHLSDLSTVTIENQYSKRKLKIMQEEKII